MTFIKLLDGSFLAVAQIKQIYRSDDPAVFHISIVGGGVVYASKSAVDALVGE